MRNCSEQCFSDHTYLHHPCPSRHKLPDAAPLLCTDVPLHRTGRGALDLIHRRSPEGPAVPLSANGHHLQAEPPVHGDLYAVLGHTLQVDGTSFPHSVSRRHAVIQWHPERPARSGVRALPPGDLAGHATLFEQEVWLASTLTVTHCKEGVLL